MSQNAQTTAANVLPAVPSERRRSLPPVSRSDARVNIRYLDRRDVDRITLSGTAGDVRSMLNDRALIRRRMRQAQERAATASARTPIAGGRS
jgi:hypothetical protein